MQAAYEALNGDSCEESPEKFAVLLEASNGASFSGLRDYDHATVALLRASGEYTLRIAVTSKALTSDSYQNKTESSPLVCGKSIATRPRHAQSNIRVSSWRNERDERIENYYLQINDFDAVHSHGFPSFETWHNRVLLVFWPRAHDTRLACAAGSYAIIRHVRKAIDKYGPVNARSFIGEAANYAIRKKAEKKFEAIAYSIPRFLALAIQSGDVELRINALGLMVPAEKESNAHSNHKYGLSYENLDQVRHSIHAFGWKSVSDSILSSFQIGLLYCSE